MSATVGAHTGASPLSLMSCVRESSPLQDYDTDVEKNVVSKRKFWNPKKWFRKKQKTSDDNLTHGHHHHHSHQEHRDVDGSRSRSTGELSTDEEPSRSHEVRNSSSMHPGLSVSHDSVFHPLNSGSSDLELDGAQSSSSLSISQPLGDIKLQTELSSRLQLRRGRGDTSEDDEGFPRSPLCGSPAAVTDSFLILEKAVNKDLPTKSHSTCSDGSLLSMDGSEIEEDSIGLPSRNSSKVSLNEKKPELDSDIELGPSYLSVPLNHSAAHHRVSVRPKRTYGAPRRKKGQIATALPATPEVNEESSTRSISPESITTEPITELYSSASRTSALTVQSYETKLKCNSLPAGVIPPTSNSFRLNRSKSNAGKSQDDAALHPEEKEEKLSLFERLFPRRSGKKKKKEEKMEKTIENVVMEVDSSSVRRTSEEKASSSKSNPITISKMYAENKSRASHSYMRREEVKPVVVPRTGAASRQRIQPIDIPSSPRSTREYVAIAPTSPTSPERLFHPGSSPIQVELENVLKQRQIHHGGSGIREPPTSPYQSSSPPSIWDTSSSVVVKREHRFYETKSNNFEIKKESKSATDDSKSKVKIAGLSSLQQRVLNISSAIEEVESSPKSLIEISPKPKKLIAKSHSFKNQKNITEKLVAHSDEHLIDNVKSVTKSSSLDSIKNLDEPILKSELQMILKPTQSPSSKIKKDLNTITPETESKDERFDSDLLSKNKEFVIDSDGSSESLKETMEQKDLINSDTSFAQTEKSEQISEENATSTSNTISSKVFEEHSVQTNSPSVILPNSFNDSIVISGPSHTAIVNVTSQSENINKNSVMSENEYLEVDGSKSIVHKESQVSVTKIHLKQKTTEVTRTSISIPKGNVPEFLNKQLNKVDLRPSSHIILSMKSQKALGDEIEHSKTKTTVSTDTERPQLFPRKFSKEDVEIIEKSSSDSIASKDVSPPKTPTLVSVAPSTPNQNRFRKNDSKPSSRKSSIISITPELPVKEHIKDRTLKTRSISLDSLKIEQNGNDTSLPDKSSQDSLDKLEKKSGETVILRRKSLVKQKNEEEPELMKVFARRSLKLKDSDIEQIQEALMEDKNRDSDKENIKEVTVEVEKTSTTKEDKARIDDISVSKTKLIKTPLNDSKKISESIKHTANDEPEVQLRRGINNNVFLASQRTVSLNLPKTTVHDFQIRKQPSLNERRKTDHWQTIKDDDVQEKKAESEIILTISEKSEEIQTVTKNFSQRRAEWEKRVQQAQK